jgi:cellulose synthase/poly-beta-1,6-N-acetylglucosamine synthase-like glycosyltransferase
MQPEGQPQALQAETMPFVSVIVPVYNAETMVGACIEALLEQDYPGDKYEIIVVDNDSTDGTARVIKQYPVKYLEERTVHTSFAARNTGAKSASGEILAFCDADQTAAPQWLRALLRRWKEPNVGAFAGEVLPSPGASTFLERYLANRESHYLDAWKKHRFGPTLGTGNAAFRADLFHGTGGFEQKSVCGDMLMGWVFSNELRKEIAYEADAIQYHRPRSTEAELKQREVRLAYGGQLLLAKQKRPGYRLSLVCRSIKHMMTGAMAFVVRHIARDDDWRFRAYSARMNAALSWAYVKGFVIYSIWGRNYSKMRY